MPKQWHEWLRWGDAEQLVQLVKLSMRPVILKIADVFEANAIQVVSARPSISMIQKVKVQKFLIASSPYWAIFIIPQ